MPQPQRELDLVALVDSVADEFERSTTVPVLPEARRVLVEPALLHEKELLADLEEERTSIPRLRRAVRTVIDNAHVVARENKAKMITAAFAEESMRRKCPYVPWC